MKAVAQSALEAEPGDLNDTPEPAPRHHRTGRVIYAHWTRLDATAAAAIVGKSRWWIGAIVKHPETPFSGRYTTLAKLNAWLDSHPEFRATDHYNARRGENKAKNEFMDRLAKLSAREVSHS